MSSGPRVQRRALNSPKRRPQPTVSHTRFVSPAQPTLAHCPWLPVIGNHEGNDGDGQYRYLNMTFGETLGDDTDGDGVVSADEGWFAAHGVTSTAESARDFL